MATMMFGLPVISVDETFQRPAKGFALLEAKQANGEAWRGANGQGYYSPVYGAEEIKLYEDGKLSLMEKIHVNNGSPITEAVRVITLAAPEGVKFVYADDMGEGIGVIERLAHAKFAKSGSAVRHDAAGYPIVLALHPTSIVNPGSTSYGGFMQEGVTLVQRVLAGEKGRPCPSLKQSYEYGLWQWGRASQYADKELRDQMKGIFWAFIREQWFGAATIGDVHAMGVVGHLAAGLCVMQRTAGGDRTAVGLNNAVTFWTESVKLVKAGTSVEIKLRTK